jgi:2,5-diketo-D-gluconate reductase A
MTVRFNDPASATFTLYNGSKIPVFGFGTYKITGSNCYQRVMQALEYGYRCIDTASFYKNEEEIGKAVNDFLSKNRGKVSRDQIFIITKVWPDDMVSKDTCRKSVETSLSILFKLTVFLVVMRHQS